MTTDYQTDSDLLSRIAVVEGKIRSICDLIPLSSWGFDDSVYEKLRQRKHRIVNQKLTGKEKKRLSKAQKQHFARSLGGVCSTVSEVLDWMSMSVIKDVYPQNSTSYNQRSLQKSTTVREEFKKSSTNHNEHVIPKDSERNEPLVQESFASTSDREFDKNKVVKSMENKVINSNSQLKKQSVEVVTTQCDKELANESGVKVETMKSDDDTTDDDETMPKKGGEKRLASGNGYSNPSKRSKLDKELKHLGSIDSSKLDPIESRRVAMLKLQKKIEEMKSSRRGTKSTKNSKIAHKLEEERKIKRRISKMKMKQRKAEEKRQTTTDEKKSKETSTKSENLPRTDEGKVVYSKFDFIVKDKKKAKLSKAERREKFTGKDYKSLINKVQKREEKLKELKEKEPEMAKKMEEDIKWNRVMNKAAGIKVKDNVELLKKGLKNKQKIKEKRIDKWQKRDENVKNNQAAKQDKRKANIQKRIDEKKKRKIQILRRKGRIL